ncbi:transposase [Planctomycetaceae bacterium AH-315-I19]|nr:transposase [Planctomycetaceae bacterium AH-315-I19]
MHNNPLAFLITFRTYGTWLPGDPRGSVNKNHNTFGEPSAPPSRNLEQHSRNALKHAPVELDSELRSCVQRAIKAVCEHRNWALPAINVRSNHVHTVVAADRHPNRVMLDFKAWSTRRLREHGLMDHNTTVWARHGSTKYLFDECSVAEAVRYVRDEQDGPRFEGSVPTR